MATPEQIEALTDGLNDMVLTRSIMAAAASLVVYDWALCLNSEIELLWKAKWTSVKVLYLVNRYLVPPIIFWANYGYSGSATFFGPQSCKIWVSTDSLLNLCFYAGLHYIVSLRAWALWGRNRYLGFFIWSCFILHTAATFTLTWKAVLSIPFGLIPVVNICFGVLPSYLWAIWLPSILYEIMVFVLTAAKAFHHSKRNVETPILSVLYRDGFLYFIFISVNSFTNLLWWALAPPTRVLVIKYLSLAVCQVAGSHLILDLLKVGKKMQVQTNTNNSSHPDNVINGLRKLTVSPMRTFQVGNNSFEMATPVSNRFRYSPWREFDRKDATYDSSHASPIERSPLDDIDSPTFLYPPRDRTSRIQWADKHPFMNGEN